MTIITEAEFRERVAEDLSIMIEYGYRKPWAVMGPGRSGAVASVYVSHFLKVPFIPFGTALEPDDRRWLLIVDTARNSGRTLRRAARKYEHLDTGLMWFYNEPPRVRFWYEDWEE